MLRALFIVLSLVPTPKAPVTTVTLAEGAARKGLEFLTKDAMNWKTQRNCASCHHAPYMLWSLNEAKRRGYSVDEKALAEMTDWVSAPDDRARAVPKIADATPKVVHFNAMILALGLEAGSPADGPAAVAVKRFQQVLAKDQNEDGTWALPAGGRLPMVGTTEMMTVWTLLAMTGSGSDANKAANDKAIVWLKSAPVGDDLLAENLRLLLAVRLREPKKETSPLVKRILARQNADGGWSQSKDLSSDGYATGQAIYVLTEAGMKPGSKEIRRAQEFLIRAQREDGSWAMISRPATPGGAGSKDLVPITYAGSAWATLGLVRSTPATSAAR
jgi:squalene cyclase